MTADEAKRLRENAVVTFTPNPASRGLYSGKLPKAGEAGTVVKMNVGGSKRITYMPGPGGGLVYVNWPSIGTCGISPIDLTKGAPADAVLASIVHQGAVYSADASFPELGEYVSLHGVGAALIALAGVCDEAAHTADDVRPRNKSPKLWRDLANALEHLAERYGTL